MHYVIIKRIQFWGDFLNRYKDTKRVGIAGILGNIFLLIIKGFVGFISGSQAMIADAANSAGDIFASAMTFIGNKIASEPRDDGHNFGHGKAEYIFSFFISLSMIGVAIKLFVDAVSSLVFGSKLEFSWLLVLVCITTIIVKFCLYMYAKKVTERYNNILLKSNMKDHRNDCIVTTFTLISILFSLIGWFWVDGVVGLGISVWICYTGITIFIESYNVLMDISLDKNSTDLIYNLGKNYNEIIKIENLYSVPVGYKYVVVFTIYINGNMSTFKSHAIADSLEKDILNNIEQIDSVIIHVHPM